MHSPQRGVSPGTRGQPSSLPSLIWFAHLDFCLRVQASGHLPGILPYTYSEVGQDREFHSYKGNQHLDSLEQPPAAQGRLAVCSPGGVTSHLPPPRLSHTFLSSKGTGIWAGWASRSSARRAGAASRLLQTWTAAVCASEQTLPLLTPVSSESCRGNKAC